MLLGWGGVNCNQRIRGGETGRVWRKRRRCWRKRRSDWPGGELGEELQAAWGREKRER